MSVATIGKIVIAAVILSLALIGCAPETGEVGEARQGSNRPADDSAEVQEPEVEEAEVEEPEQSSELAFGETFTYENGLSVTVSAPEPFTPSDVSAGGENFSAHVRFNVTVVNGTDERYEPLMFSTSLQSANQEGDAVFDNGLEGAPTTVLLPGREATFPVGYGVANPEDLVLEVSPGFEYESIVYFTG